MLGLARNLVIVSILIVAVFMFLKPSDIARMGGKSSESQTRVASSQSSQRSSLTNQIVLERHSDGHYYVTAEVEGVPVDFLVDTGASMIALTREDAERVGLRPGDLNYTMRAQTANGIALFAPVTLEDVAIEQIEIDDVRAAVSRSHMGMSLLGMSFLGRLDGYQVEDGNLILYW